MLGERPRGDSSIAALGHSHCWSGIVCLPRKRFALALCVYLFALFALLVSAISPLDDSLQPDFSHHSRSWHRTVIAPKKARPIHLIRRHCAAPVALGACASHILHLTNHVAPVLHAHLNPPGLRRAHTGRAPPLPLLLPRST